MILVFQIKEKTKEQPLCLTYVGGRAWFVY